MTHSVEAAVARLSATFPLADRLEALDDGVRAVHAVILAAFLDSGEPPAVEALPGEALAELVAIDAVVFRGGRIVGAYPFSAESTGHSVTIGDLTVGSMCSLDALAVSPVFGVDTVVRSTCAVTGDPIEVTQPGFDPGSPVHVGIHFQDPATCAASSLCREMVFLRDAETAAGWRQVAPADRGVYGLAEAVEFADAFFRPIVGRR